MQHDQLSLFETRPSRSQVRTILAAAALLFLAYFTTVPFQDVRLARIDAFVPVFDTILLMADLVTAALLFAQASVFRSRALIALASGYLFTALIVVPHALTFPGAFSPTGLLGAEVDTTVWIYFFWRGGFPIAVILYAVLKRADAAAPAAVERPHRWIVAGIAGAVLITAALTLLATAGHALLPRIMIDSMNWDPVRATIIETVLIAVLAAAMLLVWRAPRSLLDLWLLLALWAWVLQLLLVMQTGGRFTLAWYSGRLAGLLAHVLVMLALLAESHRIYARLALSAMVREREREGRLMSMDAVAASIAHEVKQPLTAIVANAGAARRWLDRDPPDVGEASAALAAIAADGHRVGEVIGSIRAIFGRRSGERTAFSINDLVRDTTALMAPELAVHGVALRLDLDEALPPVLADRVQMQQVLLNLFTNSIEAMDGSGGRGHWIAVRSGRRNGADLVIEISDSGTGLAPDAAERIFDAFFTTKAQGTGMGLALCRSIVEAHGGRLWATSGETGGATFHIQLPHGAPERP